MSYITLISGPFHKITSLFTIDDRCWLVGGNTSSQSLSLEQDCPGRGTVKQVWKAATKTAKPLRSFCMKTNITIMGVIEGYHTNLGYEGRKGAKKNVHISEWRVNIICPHMKIFVCKRDEGYVCIIAADV